jgi:DNA-binding transcriptional LysR family regulator
MADAGGSNARDRTSLHLVAPRPRDRARIAAWGDSRPASSGTSLQRPAAPEERARVRYDLRLLESFLVLAEELHFGRAAVRLGFAQPTLSQQIRRLETQLGVALLTRDARHVRLTAAGTAFREQATVSLFAAIQAGEGAVAAAHGLFGELAVAAGPDALSITRSLCRAFTERHSGVDVTIISAVDAACFKALAQRTVDAAMVWSTGPPPRGYEQASTPAAVGQVSLRLHRSHRLAGLPAVPCEQLRDERLIMFPRKAAPDQYDELVALFGGHDRSGGIHETSYQGPDARYEMMRSLDDHSFTLGPSRRDDPHDLSEIVIKEIFPPPARTQLWLVWAAHSHGPLRAFEAFVRRAYASGTAGT